ncbi:MAG: hypothetical protein KF805_17350 [Phycisphaeraceae bacterium]|nr:hypothetical protein [Phycisphaeraceae bacterium]
MLTFTLGRSAPLCILLLVLGACCHEPGSKADAISSGHTIDIMQTARDHPVDLYSSVVPGKGRDDGDFIAARRGSGTITRINPTTGSSEVLRSDLEPGIAAIRSNSIAWAMVQQGNVTVADYSGKVLWDHIAGPSVSDVFLAPDTSFVVLTGALAPTDNLGLSMSGVRAYESGWCATVNSLGERSALLATDSPGRIFATDTVVCILPTQIQIVDPMGQYPPTRGYIGDAFTSTIAADRSRNMLLLKRYGKGFLCAGASTIERRKLDNPNNLVWEVPQTLLATGYVLGNEIVSCQLARTGDYVAYLTKCSVGAINVNDPSRRVEIRFKDPIPWRGVLVELGNDTFAVIEGTQATALFTVREARSAAEPLPGN